MTKVNAEVLIDATRSDVWRILANLESLSEYDAAVAKAFYVSDAREGVGAARQCDLPSGGYIRERITDWRPEEGYALDVYEGTGVESFDSVGVSFRLEDAGPGTKVALEVDSELRPDALGMADEIDAQYRELVDSILGGLKQYVETGLLVTSG